MSDDSTRDFDEQSSKRVTEQYVEGPSTGHGASSGTEAMPSYPTSLLSDARINGRGNQPVRTAIMQRLQQTYGNRAVQRFLQRKETDATGGGDEDLSQRIQSRAGGGSSLDGGVQRTLESGLGADLSNVRVHTDGEADHMARSVDSVAFTTGSDIFFREGMYNPGSSDGMRLLAHEATHTVQQSQGPVSGTPSAGGVSISDPSDSYEQAAERSADNVMAGVSASANAQRMEDTSGATSTVQREAESSEQEEEEPVQAMRASTYSAAVQRQEGPAGGLEEEEPVQAMRSSTYSASPLVQRVGAPEEEEAQEEESVQTMSASAYVQREGGGRRRGIGFDTESPATEL